MLCCRARVTPGRAEPAAHPQTEFTTTSVVPGLFKTSSTFSLVCTGSTPHWASSSGQNTRTPCAFYLFIRQLHGAEVSPAARNTLDSARIPRASKLLICGLFQKGRVLAQDGIASFGSARTSESTRGSSSRSSLARPAAVLALFAVGDVYVSLCKKSAYAPFSARRRSRALFWL